VSLLGTDIEKARALLCEGKLVAIPTETVYGLAANALDSQAVLNIFEAKNRPAFDPLIIHTHSVGTILNYVEDFPEKAYRLAEIFWPGPLTLLLPKKCIIPDLVTSGLPNVAVRIPNHPLTLRLLQSLDFPLAAPSANPFGYISPTTAGHVNEQLGDKVPYILDGGPSQVGIESTIISFQEDQPTVLRLGGLQLEDIESVIGKVKTTLHSSSNPAAPGMLKSHYAPRKALSLISAAEMPAQDAPEDIGFLYFKGTGLARNHPFSLTLSETGDLREAAYHLFDYLRKMDDMPVREIWAEKLPDEGLGRAINDRLRRASVRETYPTH
jgi:L-threonylcarbamoyladenylate synthase